MALFPEVAPAYPYTPSVEFNNLKLGPTDGDYVQRRRKRLTPLHSFKLKWQRLTTANEKLLYDFFTARYGGWEAFEFYDFDALKSWTLAIGTGDGTTTDFLLQGKDIQNLVVQVAGVTKALGTDYTFGDGTGTDGQDKITFIAGHIPTTGQAITATWTGRRYFTNMVFDEDNLDRESFFFALYQSGLTIRQVSS